jgi:branched-chain amino acid transport system substrate-binding protein
VNESQYRLSRDALLKRAGVAGAALTVPAFGRLTAPAHGLVAQRRPLRIGLLLTLSGPLASIGVELQKGFVTFVKQRGGRLGGRRVQFFVEDDSGDPSRAIEKSRRLIGENVDFVAGVAPSNVAIAIRDTYHDSKTVLVIANAAANEVTREKRSPYIFRSCYTNWMIGASFARWFYNNIAKDGVFTAGANYAAGQEIVGGFVERYRAARGRIEGQVFPPLGTVADYSPYLSQIANARPKACYAFFPAADALKFVRQYSEFGLRGRIPLYGSFITDPQQVLNAQGQHAEGLITNAIWAPGLKNPVNRRFVRDYNRFFSAFEPSVFSVTAWEAAAMLDKALLALRGDVGNKARLIRAL